MKSKFLSLLILLFSFATSIAQQKTITGQVTKDNSTEALAGVTVSVKGAKTSTATNNTGNFTITVTGNNAVLIFTSVGYARQEVTVGNNTNLSIRLAQEASALDDVVVIGYQTVKKKDVLGSISSISARDLRDVPITNIAEALNGRLAGLTATVSEGSPDASVRVRIRGGMSITGNNDPLYIIDGVQVESGLSSISPQDIQSIDVLKDASATAIYGARGANGVIIITTKTGKPGRTIVTYNSFVGIKKIAKELDVLDPYDFVIYQAERARVIGAADSTGFLKAYGTTWDTLNVYKNFDKVDWQKEVFGRTGLTTTHNVSVSGGNNKITFNLGYTFNHDKAIVLNSSYNRHLLNFKSDYKVTKNFKIGLSSRVSNVDVYGAGVSADNGSSSLSRLRNAVKYRPYLSTAQDIDEYVDPTVGTGVGNGLNLVNPIQLANSEYRKKTTNSYNVTVNAQYTIVKNLVFKSTVGYDWNKKYDKQYFDTLSSQSKSNNTKPFVTLDTTTLKTLTNSNVLTYSIQAWRDHHFDFLVGEETYDLRTLSNSTQIRNYPYNVGANYAFAHQDSGATVTGYPRVAESRFTQLSFFGRIGYNYKDKYLLSGNLRRDGASKFAPNQRWGMFPAGSVAWRVKQEKFMQNANFINDLKLRFGIGTMGNNRIGDYLYLNTFSASGSRYYALNGQAVIGYVPNSLPNELLKWESTVNRNWGVDMTLFKRKLDVSVDYYINTSKDLLLNVNIDPTYGFATQTQNVGKTENKGIELQINATIIRKPNNGLNWTASFNISHNDNKVVALGPGQTEALIGPALNIASNPADYILRIGQPVGTMYGLVTDGFYTVNDFDYDPTTSQYSLKKGIVDNSSVIGTPIRPGSIKYKDLNNDGKVDVNNDRTIIGNPNPKLTGGLNQQVSYKNWDVSLFVNFMYDFDVFNANRLEFSNAYSVNSNLLADFKNRWTNIDPATGQSLTWLSAGKVYGVTPDKLSAVNANATIWSPIISTGAFTPHSWAIEDGSFLRFNNLTVGYTLPIKTVKSLHMSKLRFYFTANNFAIITNYSGFDPEVSVRTDARTPNLDYSAYPKSRSYIFGLNATF